ncbi:MAG: PKD domain-containing protein [bacterium]|nr:PKD domain-containing protein [bacterium]
MGRARPRGNASGIVRVTMAFVAAVAVFTWEVQGQLCPWSALQQEFEIAGSADQRSTLAQLPPFVAPEGPTNPMGVARGIFPGRVVWDYDPLACRWDGRFTNESGGWIPGNYWWLTNYTDQARVDAMVSRCIRWLTGATNDAQAWRAMFVYFNADRGLGSNGYVHGEGVSITPNFVNCWSWVGNPYGDKPNQYYRAMTTRQVVLSVLRQLVYQAGVPQEDITLYCDHVLSHFLYEYFTNEFPRVRYADRLGKFGREQNTNDYGHPIYPSNGILATDWPAHTLTRSKYAINVANLKSHEAALPGSSAEFPTLCAKNHFGSLVDGAGVYHPHIEATNAYGTYHILPDLMEHKKIGGHTLLYVLDGLYGGLDHWDSVPKRWCMEPFRTNWPASILMSLDGVAIDSVGTDFLVYERMQQNDPLSGSIDSYLHEAALITNPPSGIVYDPDADGPPERSLGVHEHWTDATRRWYSRNLGLDRGIELFTWEPLRARVWANVTSILVRCPLYLQAEVLDHGRRGRGIQCCWDVDGDGTYEVMGEDIFILTTTYDSVGVYWPRLLVSNALGEVNLLVCTNLIQARPGVEAAFSAWPTNGNIPLTVTFTDLSRNDPQYWHWEFGDGTSTQQHPRWTFETVGWYTVRLVVSNDFGEAGRSWSERVYTNMIHALPEAGVVPLVAALGAARRWGGAGRTM